ncbi:MAG TPA: hypothetical protein VFB81_11025, partial [Myxococcales bacterium]|nr:hypothetical protein [Myxococcales bacterium]
MRPPLLPVLAIVLALSSGCQPDPAPRRAFYFWRTRFALSAPEREVLTRQRVTRIYLRLLDVV